MRSSLLFGLHATGLTQAILRKLEAVDARFVRAIARDPVHLTRTSNVALYQRLRVKPIALVLEKLLKGRAKKSRDAAAVAAFQAQLHHLQDWACDARASQRAGLLQIEAGRQYPCAVCGQYFASMQHLLSHQARQHPEQVPKKTGRMHSQAYVAGTVDGMPTCVHCSASFTRVEALKKHLHRACPVLHGKQSRRPEPPPTQYHTDPQASHTVFSKVGADEGTAVKVAAAPAGLHGSSDRALPTLVQTGHVPLIADDAFRKQLKLGWKTVLRCKEYATSLCTYCVLCGQWIDVTGVKQHHRLMHAAQWALKSEACARIGTLGLVVLSPCHYCGRAIKDPRTHLKACASVYQASIAELFLRQELHGEGGRDADCGGPRDDGCLGHGKGQHGAELGRSSGSAGECQRPGGGHQAPAEVVPEPGQGSGWRKRLHMGSLEQVCERLVRGRQGEPGQSRSGQGHATLVVGVGEDGHPARGGAGQDPHRHDDDLVPGHGQHRDCALGSPGSRDMGQAVRGWHSPLASEGGPLALDRPGSQCTNLGGYPGGGQAGEGQGMEVAPGGPHGPGSMLDVLPVESRGKAAGTQPGAADQEFRGEGPSRLSLAQPGGGERADEVQGHPPHVGNGSLRQRGIAIFLLPQSSGRHSQQVSCGPARPGELLGAETGGYADQACQRRAPTPGNGAGEGLLGGPLHGVAGPAKLVDATDAQASAGAGRRGQGPLRAPALVHVCRGALPALPVAQLQNPHQICYVNAVAQALCWLALLTGDAHACGGKASAAIMLVATAPRAYLPSCLAWHPILRGWRNLSLQHDAGVFMSHVLKFASPAALRGSWQARLSNPDTIVDEGPLDSPVPMEVRGQTLHDVVQHWHMQHTVHALASHSGVAVLQLNRYTFVEGRACKLHDPIHIVPGSVLRVPVFSEGGVAVAFQPFRVIFVIFHVGDRVTNGHYQAALCSTHGSSGAQHEGHADHDWCFHVCNDRAKPRPARATDLTCIDHNAYLVGLLQCQPTQHA